jgi:hypothetical protein
MVRGVPQFFHLCDTNDIVIMVSEMLNRLVAYNDYRFAKYLLTKSFPLSSQTLTRFHSRTAPSITIPDYLRRIVKYASTEKSVLILILIFIDRVCEKNKSFTLCSLTSHRYLTIFLEFYSFNLF